MNNFCFEQMTIFYLEHQQHFEADSQIEDPRGMFSTDFECARACLHIFASGYKIV